MEATTRDLTRTTLAVLGIGLLIGGSLSVLMPFLAALLWAAMIAVSTWPLLLRIQRRLGGRRGAAVAVMAAVLLLVLFVPLFLAIAVVVRQSDRIGDVVRTLTTVRVPPPPAWVDAVPLVGARTAQRWAALSALEPQELTARVAPYLGTAVAWFAGKAGGIGARLVQFLLTVVITAVLYAKGEDAVELVRGFFRRLSGAQRGDAIVTLAGKAIRAVALGVVVTALVQAGVAALGLVAVGVPFPGLVTAVVFLLCIAQLGPILAMVPWVVWLYATGSPGRGTVLLVITLVAQTFDNVLRPLLIRRGGAELSLLLIFPGVVGGLLWLGIVGLFVGPVILAVTWTLLQSWIASGPAEPASEPIPVVQPPAADAREAPAVAGSAAASAAASGADPGLASRTSH